MLSTPRYSQRAGVSRTNAAPSVRHPSAVSRLAASSPGHPGPAGGDRTERQRHRQQTALTAMDDGHHGDHGQHRRGDLRQHGEPARQQRQRQHAERPHEDAAGCDERPRRRSQVTQPLERGRMGSATTAPWIVASATYSTAFEALTMHSE